MARTTTRSRQTNRLIERTVAAYVANIDTVSLFRTQLLSALTESKTLAPHVHSFRTRIKEPDHLRAKLERKARSIEAGAAFDISPENVLTRINDLVGIRILHLYTRQIREIDAALRAILEEQQYALVEGPMARTWDDEYRQFFAECGIDTRASETMYTSVHYVVGSSSRTPVTAELQVRTLMEEVWGEVDHKLNYPIPTSSVPCREQLKVLARVTSSATRLVDAIFLTAEDHENRGKRASLPLDTTPPRRRGGSRR